MTLESMDSTLKSMDDRELVMLSGIRADKSTYQKEFYAADARQVIKELESAGTKINSITKLQKDTSGNILPPSNSDIITQEKQQKITEQNNKVITTLSEDIKSFPPEIAAAFSENGVDYSAISKAISDVYFQGDTSKTIKPETLKDWDNTLKDTSDDLITDLKLLTAGLIENRKVEEKIVKNTDDTKKSSEKTASNTKGLQGFDTKALERSVFNTPSLGTIKDDYSGALKGTTPTATTPTGAGAGAYGGAVRIGLDAQGRQVAVIGQVAQRNWQTGWANQEDLSGPSKNAMSVGNSIVKIEVDSSAYDSKKVEMQQKVIKPLDIKISSYPDFSSILATQTKFINVVTNYTNNSAPAIAAATGSVKPFAANPANIPTKTITFKKYHSGGVTPGSPNQEMLAIVRGQERIIPLDSKQQSSGTVHIHIHAEGATFIGNRGITQLAEEVSKYQNDKTIFTVV
jgi:hypothetical protein